MIRNYLSKCAFLFFRVFASKYQEDLESKLENPEKLMQQYTMTNKGINMQKGQEIGYFKMGSSIMLIFETPKSAQFIVKTGDEVKLGNSLLKSE
jgi:phosphatidylserine decarboxylase